MHSLMFSTCFLLFSTVAARLSTNKPRDQAIQRSYVTSNGNSTIFTGDDPAELVKRDGTKYVFMHHVRLSSMYLASHIDLPIQPLYPYPII